MKRFLLFLTTLYTLCFSAFGQAGDLPAGYLGSVLQYTTGTQSYSYTFTPTVSGVDYVGFAFRQDPGFWTFTSPKVTAGNSTTNLLLNGNLTYGGGLSVNTANYGSMYIQAPSDWGVWYQNGTYPAAAGTWSPGQWYDGAVGSYDGIYQGINVTAGTTYHISFNLYGTNPSSNPSIEVGTYMGACAAGSTIFTCVPNSSASMSAIASPGQTQSVGGAPTITSQSTTNSTSTVIIGTSVTTVTTPTTTYTWSDGSTTTSQGSATSTAVATNTITGARFGPAQVADTQWNVGACMYSSTCQIYSTSPGGTYETGSWRAIGSTQYITLIPNTGTDSSRNPWSMVLVNSDGTFSSLGTGRILVQGSDSSGHIYIFFTNDNYNGTLLSGNLGLTGQGMTFSGTANPTPAQTNTLAGGMSTTTLSGGQTGGAGAPAAPTVTGTANSTITTTSVNGNTTSTYSQPVTITSYSDGSTTTANNGAATLISTSTTGTAGITAAQQNHVTAVQQRQAAITPNTGSSIYIQQSGSGDTYNITQIGTGNKIDGATFDTNTGAVGYQTYAQFAGGNNQVRIRQGDPATHAGKNIVDVSVNGAGNYLNLNQGTDANGLSTGLDTGSHYQFVWVNGGSNNVTTVQQGTNYQPQFGVVSINGVGNTIQQTQSGATNNQSFIGVQGNYNNIAVSQNGTTANQGNYSSIVASGNNNTANVTQTGAGNNANITLVNAGSPASVTLTQTGGQNYAITQTCYTAACGTITLRQGN